MEEISHMFKEKEARPPDFVSDAFTALCLSPLLSYLVAEGWYKLGLLVFVSDLAQHFYCIFATG